MRKQAALVARCSNKFGISLLCTAFVYRKRGELLDKKATSKRAGSDAGLVWCTPWEADITDFIKKGKNDIRIEVRNSLVNRLVGDEQLPESERKTWIYTQLYNAKSSLVPSGIIGKVDIVER